MGNIIKALYSKVTYICFALSFFVSTESKSKLNYESKSVPSAAGLLVASYVKNKSAINLVRIKAKPWLFLVLKKSIRENRHEFTKYNPYDEDQVSCTKN